MCSVYAVALYSTSVCQKSLVGLESFDPVPTLIREHDQFLYALDLNARECDIHIWLSVFLCKKKHKLSLGKSNFD